MIYYAVSKIGTKKKKSPVSLLIVYMFNQKTSAPLGDTS